jgi:hypothetical protein
MKVWQIGDGDWWMAPTAAEALDAAGALYGLPPAELAEDGVHELSDADLERLTFFDDLSAGPGMRWAVCRTFAEEFKRRMATDPTTQIFAASEC